jgi:hypothetical protein
MLHTQHSFTIGSMHPGNEVVQHEVADLLPRLAFSMSKKRASQFCVSEWHITTAFAPAMCSPLYQLHTENMNILWTLTELDPHFWIKIMRIVSHCLELNVTPERRVAELSPPCLQEISIEM